MTAWARKRDRVTIQSTDVERVSCARLTGVLYLIIIVCALFGEAYARSSIIEHGDAAATARNLVTSDGLFRAGIISDIVAFSSDVVVAVLLYVLLRPVSRTVALITAAFRLTGTAIYGVNLLNGVAALLASGGAGYLAVFEPAQLEALALLFLNLHGYGYDLGLVFFGLHCFGLGVLLIRSEEFPGILGVLMALAALVYLVGSVTRFLSPGHANTLVPLYGVPLIAELSLSLWLMIKGVRTPVPDRIAGG